MVFIGKFHFTKSIQYVLQNSTIESNEVGKQPNQQDLESNNHQNRGENHRLNMPCALTDENKINVSDSEQQTNEREQQTYRRKNP